MFKAFDFCIPTAAKARPGARRRGPTQPAALDAQNQPRAAPGFTPFEQGEIGPELFEAASRMGLEGLVSKRRDRPYRDGRSPDWIKVKNRKHPAIGRVMDSFR